VWFPSVGEHFGIHIRNLEQLTAKKYGLVFWLQYVCVAKDVPIAKVQDLLYH
jgi:hypothetical protein